MEERRDGKGDSGLCDTWLGRVGAWLHAGWQRVGTEMVKIGAWCRAPRVPLSLHHHHYPQGGLGHLPLDPYRVRGLKPQGAQALSH